MSVLTVLSMISLATGTVQDLPESVVLKTLVRYDKSALEKFGGQSSEFEVWIEKVKAKVQPVMQKLDVRVDFEIENIEFFDARIPYGETSKESWEYLQQYHNSKKEKKFVSYFCDGCFGGGWGNRGVPCYEPSNGVKQFHAMNLNGGLGGVEYAAAIWIHELGHSIGMT